MRLLGSVPVCVYVVCVCYVQLWIKPTSEHLRVIHIHTEVPVASLRLPARWFV